MPRNRRIPQYDLCDRCVQGWTDEDGVKHKGTHNPSVCTGCGVCKDCEHFADCPNRIKKYFVQYGDHDEYFVCQAESADHAGEQCHDFTGGQTIHGIWEGKQDDNWVQ